MSEVDYAGTVADGGFQQAKRRAERLRRTTVTEEVGHGLGSVVVDGYGRLRSITVDREAFHLTNEAALGKKIVEAVNRVEDRVERLRAEKEGEFR